MIGYIEFVEIAESCSDIESIKDASLERKAKWPSPFLHGHQRDGETVFGCSVQRDGDVLAVGRNLAGPESIGEAARRRQRRGLSALLHWQVQTVKALALPA